MPGLGGILKQAATAAGDFGAIRTILDKVSNPDKFLATFAGNNVDSKTKYIDDVVTLSKAGSAISQFMPGAPAIPEIDENTKEYINKLVDNGDFKTIISEINTNADLKDKVMLKLSDGKSTVKFASGLMANLQAGNIDSVVTIINKEFDTIKSESVAPPSASSNNNVSSASVPAAVQSDVPTRTGVTKTTAVDGTVTTTETKKDENCGEMRKMFQDVVISSFTDDNTKENEMLVGLITKMILENNSKFVKAIVSTIPTPNQSTRIRFARNLNDKLKRGNLVVKGGKRTKRKQGTGTGTKHKNVTRRRK